MRGALRARIGAPDLSGRPVDLPDGEAERERSSRPGESSLAVVIRTRTTFNQRSEGRHRTQ